MSGTIRKHRPRGVEPFLLAMREEKAKTDWEDQKSLIERLIKDLRSLPNEARKDIFDKFCTVCGSNDPACHNSML